MTGHVDRSALVALLEKLGNDNDEDVLSAARQAHALVAAAGASWSELMASDRIAVNNYAPSDEDRETDGIVEDDQDNGWDDIGANMVEGTDLANLADATTSPSGATRDHADILRLLDRLLAQEKGDPEFCAELDGYKQDIANGEFDDRDRSYVRDLYDRLRKV